MDVDGAEEAKNSSKIHLFVSAIKEAVSCFMAKINNSRIEHEYIKNAISSLETFTPDASKANLMCVEIIKHLVQKKDGDCNNIALEGGYGTGKSSIIRNLINDKHWTKKYRPKVISFLTLDNKERIKEKKKKEDRAESSARPEKAKTIGDIPIIRAGSDISREIQSEIVRQLFYGEKPNKLRGSGYSRRGSTNHILAVFLGIVLELAVLTKKTNFDLHAAFNWVLSLRYSTIEIVDCCLALSLVLIISLPFFVLSEIALVIFSNAKFKRIGLSDINIELSDETPDFEQMADFIIYYFNKTKRRVVIIEDLDRFNDYKVFEELRRLNFLINAGRRKSKKVKFIYAIRGDVLFDDDGIDDDSYRELIAKKPKLFDAIVPIVPFISKASAESISRKLLSKFKGIPSGILDDTAAIIANSTADMRTIKMTINYIEAQIDSWPNNNNNTDLKNMISIALIRAFSPTDYEKLADNTSRIDTIKGKLGDLKRKAIENVAKKYTLTEIIKGKEAEIWKDLKSIKGKNDNYYPARLVSKGESLAVSNTNDLLEKMIEANSDVTIEWGNYGSFSQYSSDEIIKTISRYCDLASYENREELIRKDREELRNRDLFSFHDDEIEQIASIIDDYPTIISDLLSYGFLSEAYLCFVSSDSASYSEIEAINYIARYIHGSNEMHDRYLSCETIKYIFRKLPIGDFASPGLYHRDILDYIVEYGHDAALVNDETAKKINKIFQNLVNNQDRFKSFLMKYLKDSIESVSDRLDGISAIVIGRADASLVERAIIKISGYLSNEMVQWIAEDDEILESKKVRLFGIIAVATRGEGIDLKDDKTNALFYRAMNEGLLDNPDGSSTVRRLMINNVIAIEDLNIIYSGRKEAISDLDNVTIRVNERNTKYLGEDGMLLYLDVVISRNSNISNGEGYWILKSRYEKLKQFLLSNFDQIVNGGEIDGVYFVNLGIED